MHDYTDTLKQLRAKSKTRGYMQQLSFEARVAYPVIQRLVSGETKSPRVSTWSKISAAIERIDDRESKKSKKGGKKDEQK